MKLLIACLSVFAAANSLKIVEVFENEWLEFTLRHEKQYLSKAHEELSKQTFMTNKNKVAQHNQKYERGEVSFKLGINKYADMPHDEFRRTLNGYNFTAKKLLGEEFRGFTFIEPANVELPTSVDWRDHGAVTEVKDQGHCGSCWAFSSTGALEGQEERVKGVLISLSEQNLVDCSATFGNNGCNGGLMDNAFNYIKSNGGIDTEKSYPYEGKDDTCHYDASNKGATDKGFVDIPSGNIKKLKAAVATIGPVAVAIDASQSSFQLYSEGVYIEPNCSEENLDHGVLVVGYGTDEEGVDYFIVKNSWGKSWGEDGYIKMAAKDNQCGIATAASYPLV